jgi:hypothetical protein
MLASPERTIQLRCYYAIVPGIRMLGQLFPDEAPLHCLEGRRFKLARKLVWNGIAPGGQHERLRELQLRRIKRSCWNGRVPLGPSNLNPAGVVF